MSERNQKFILLAVGVFAMSILVGYLVFAWTEPSQNPPGGNVPAPINVGSTAQTKTGNLTIPNLYLNAIANEGNIYAIDQLIGYNDLRLKGNTTEAAPIYYGASEHRFYTAGTERLTILNNGNVGIGTTTPSYKLDVSGDVRWTGTLQGGSVPWQRLTNFPSACPSGQFVTAVGTTLTCASPPSGGIGGSGTTNYIAKFTGSTTIGNSLIYDNGTNVGIGTTAPNYKLTVSGGDIYGSNNLYIAGNVGIGTTGPAYKLDVSGDVRWTGTLQGGSVPWARLTSFPSDCPSGQYVYGVGGTLKCSAPAGGIGGSGTTNYVAKFTGSTTIGNSIIYDDGSKVGIGTTSPDPNHKLTVSGSMRSQGAYFEGNVNVGYSGTSYSLTVNGQNVCLANGTNCPAGSGLWALSGSNIYNTNSGNVGIGTTAPSYKLHVQGGDIYSSGYVRGGTGLCIGSDCRTSWPGGIGGSGTTNYLAKWTGSTSLGNSIIYDNGTNVGIGTTAPSHKLHIAGSDSTLRLEGTGSYGSRGKINFGDGDYVYIQEDADDYLTIYAKNRTAIMGGNVGIGTTVPSYKLHVQGGDIYSSGYVRGGTGLCIGSDCRTSWPSGGGGGISYWTVTNSAGAGAPTTWTDLLTLNFSVSTNSVLQIFFSGTATHQCSAGLAWVSYRVLVDGGNVAPEVAVSPDDDLTDSSMQYYVPVSIIVPASVSSGSHTVKVQHQASVSNCWWMLANEARLTVFAFGQ